MPQKHCESQVILTHKDMEVARISAVEAPVGSIICIVQSLVAARRLTDLVKPTAVKHILDLG